MLINVFVEYLQHQAYVSFRRYCMEAETLPVDLHVVISDILQVNLKLCFFYWGVVDVWGGFRVQDM